MKFGDKKRKLDILYFKAQFLTELSNTKKMFKIIRKLKVPKHYCKLSNIVESFMLGLQKNSQPFSFCWLNRIAFSLIYLQFGYQRGKDE